MRWMGASRVVLLIAFVGKASGDVISTLFGGMGTWLRCGIHIVANVIAI